jgi:death-on-curing protein
VKPRFLTLADVLIILQDQIRRYGGSYGVRDPALLSSALAMPTATFEGKLLHSDIYQQAAAYAFHICQNHPFVDGNKRTALASALVFMDLNGVEIHDPDEKLYPLMMDVAAGRKGKADISRILASLAKTGKPPRTLKSRDRRRESKSGTT